MIRRVFWSVCRLLYLCVVKPILFIFPPDKVHQVIIRFSSVVGRVAVFRRFVGLIFKRSPDTRLTQEFHGVKFNNPVGLAAGFDKNGEIMSTIAALGFGFGTVGSVTAKRCPGNPHPWFYRLPKTKAAVVNAGLNNDGSKTIINRLRQYNQKTINQFPTVLSVAKTNSRKVVDVKTSIADYIATIKLAKDETNIQMIEINISCPNAYGGEPFTTLNHLDQLLSAIDKVGVNQPIFIKMPVDLSWSAFKALLDVIIKHQVVGVTIANLLKDRSKINLKDELPDTVLGNISGKPTFQPSNDLICKTYQNYGDKLTIIGVGGIFSVEDAYTKIKLGASLVEIFTGMLYSGPQLAAEIGDGLAKRIERDGYTNINQAIGIDTVKKSKKS